MLKIKIFWWKIPLPDFFSSNTMIFFREQESGDKVHIIVFPGDNTRTGSFGGDHLTAKSEQQ
jgi:hypothetical protein